MKSSIEQGESMIIARLHPESIGEAELLVKMYESITGNDQVKKMYGLKPGGGFDMAVESTESLIRKLV